MFLFRRCVSNDERRLKNYIKCMFAFVYLCFYISFLNSRPPVRSISVLAPPGLGVPRLPPGRKPPGPPPGPPPPQVLQMYGRKVGFTLEMAPRRREEEISYGSEAGKDSCYYLGFSSLFSYG